MTIVYYSNTLSLHYENIRYLHSLTLWYGTVKLAYLDGIASKTLYGTGLCM